MSNVYAIDLPSLCRPCQSGVNEVLVLTVLEGLNNLKSSTLLFRNELWSFVDFKNRPFLEMLTKALTNFNFTEYYDAIACGNLTIDPDIAAVNDSNMKDEIRLQCSYFHRKGICLILTFPQRWTGQGMKLVTESDNKVRDHDVKVINDTNSWETYVKSKMPLLNQTKHMHERYVRSGRTISPFTSYNPRNEEPAKRLLFQAYLDCQDEEEFPKHLYTWDATAMVYVKFNKSGRNEYHGYDLSKSEYSEIPSYIKDIYHH